MALRWYEVQARVEFAWQPMIAYAESGAQAAEMVEQGIRDRIREGFDIGPNAVRVPSVKESA